MLASVAGAVDAEEVLDALRDLAVLAVDGLVGGQRDAREGALLGHGGVARGGGAEELRHGGGTQWSEGECRGGHGVGQWAMAEGTMWWW